MSKRTTVYDIANALDISTGTVHRALHDGTGISPATKKKVLRMAKRLGYKPNLAARTLSQKRKPKISVNTLQGTTSFWDEVRTGVVEEARAQGIENIEIEFRTFPNLGEGDDEAFLEATEQGVDGVITFPSRPKSLRKWIRRGARAKVPTVCVVTDAPESGRVAVVSIDTHVSGSLAADLMGRFLGGRGRVAVTMSDAEITEHAEKYSAFKSTLERLYPEMELESPIEDHDLEAEAYGKSIALLTAHPDLAGIYVTTEASMPVIRAARELGMLGRLTIIATDLFPELIEEIRAGTVAATIFQRPRAQGRMAFRLLHEFLIEGGCSSQQLTLSPHLITRGSLEHFLKGMPVPTERDAKGASGRAVGEEPADEDEEPADYEHSAVAFGEKGKS
jgi:LacI family transcriptional regulator